MITVSSGAYQWGRRDCQPSTGSYSAWAVGGGADGTLPGCDSTYPDNVATTMIYGPFSLADAKMAQMHFMLRYDQICWTMISAGGIIRWHAVRTDDASTPSRPGGRRWTLTWVTWTPVTPGVSVLGEPQVWVGFRFTSDATAHTSPGPFVDDVIIRKCLDMLCSPLGAAAGH